MNKDFDVKNGSAVYDRINTVQMSDSDRQTAINAMRDADALVDGFLWISHKFEQLGTLLFLRLGIKH